MRKNRRAAANFGANFRSAAVTFCGRVPFRRSHGINQHDTADLLRIASGEEQHGQAPKRMSDQQVRWWNFGFGEKGMKLVDNAGGGARLPTRVAPAEAGPIVADDARRFRKLR